jgi:NADH:ubiquinone oxidoreductase subunit 3 (subunit A)
MIQFHFQYYWYAIVFLVFDVGFMFLVLGGVVTAEETNKGTKEAIANAEAGLAVLAAFFAIMSLGVWYVFRKRGRIYI